MRRHPCFDEQAHDAGGAGAPARGAALQHPVRLLRAQDLRQPDHAAPGLGAAACSRRTRRCELVRRPGARAAGGELSWSAWPGRASRWRTRRRSRRWGRIHQEFPVADEMRQHQRAAAGGEACPSSSQVGVTALTVTVNAPDGEVGQQIYAWVRYRGVTYRGREAAELLIANQMRGIRAALGRRAGRSRSTPCSSPA